MAKDKCDGVSGIDLIERTRQIAEDLTGLTPREQAIVLRSLLKVLEEQDGKK